MRKFLLNAFVGAAIFAGMAQAEVVVQVAPPRAIVEHRAVRPSHDHVWIGGYHRWDGHAYVWERHDGYVFVEGRWR